MLQLQADQQAEQVRMQAQAQTEQMKMQAQAQIEQGKAQLEMQMHQARGLSVGSEKSFSSQDLGGRHMVRLWIARPVSSQCVRP
jgi:uncharacterized membrane protein YqiK